MKSSVLVTMLLLGAMAQVNASESDVDLQLEPCINGEVSASGLYETQALEDRARDVAVKATPEKKRESGGSSEIVR